MADYPLGRFVWHELLTTNTDAAIDFYTKLIGWGATPMEGEIPYTMWTQGEQPLGGLMALPKEAVEAGSPPCWVGYVSTPDVDATVAKATETGAQVHHGVQEVPGMGRFAVLGDPQGAVFAVWQSSSPVEVPPFHPGVGQFSWNELATSDHEAALSFYNGLFGWEKLETFDMGEMGLYQIFGQNGRQYGGMFNKPAEMPGPPSWLYYTMVDDVHPKSEEVKESGGRILNGPMEVPDGDWIVQCLDPQGAFFALHSKKKD